jgi:hypothetical protein
LQAKMSKNHGSVVGISPNLAQRTTSTLGTLYSKI